MTPENHERDPSLADPRPVSLTLIAWLAMLGVDFFVHGGLLARLYQVDTPFLLSPEESFRRIPLGYLSFLIAAALLVWLLARLRISGWGAGLRFGLLLGAVMWGSLGLGLLSISSIRPALALGWFLGQTVELGLAGGVAGAGLAGVSRRTLFWRVLAVVIALIVATITLQSLGLAPAARVIDV